MKVFLCVFLRGENRSEQVGFESFFACVFKKRQSARVANVGWNRVPNSLGLELEGTLAERFGVSSGD